MLVLIALSSLALAESEADNEETYTEIVLSVSEEGAVKISSAQTGSQSTSVYWEDVDVGPYAGRGSFSVKTLTAAPYLADVFNEPHMLGFAMAKGDVMDPDAVVLWGVAESTSSAVSDIEAWVSDGSSILEADIFNEPHRATCADPDENEIIPMVTAAISLACSVAPGTYTISAVSVEY